MGQIWMPGGGGSADLDAMTAAAGDVLAGKVIVDAEGNPVTGTMPNKTGTALTVATNGKTLIPKGYHDGTKYATNTQATMAGQTITPSSSAQTVACNGKLMTGNIVVSAIPSNFKEAALSVSSSTKTYNTYNGTEQTFKVRTATISNLGFIPKLVVMYADGYQTIWNSNYVYNGTKYAKVFLDTGTEDIQNQYWMTSTNSALFAISSSQIVLPFGGSSGWYCACG